MAKEDYIYVCSNCGAEFPRWQGKCFECGEWNTLYQEKNFRHRGKKSVSNRKTSPIAIDDSILINKGGTNNARYLSGIEQVDKVLGGGFVAGSVILLAGEPGIGKSTLLLQICGALAKKQGFSETKPEEKRTNILYVTAEESPQQVKLRADRLGVSSPNIHLLGETNINEILEIINNQKYLLVVIDSIQMIYNPDNPSAPGSVSQVRECTFELVKSVKQSQAILILVGHITKEGMVAGPKTLEHIVDVVCYFEGERFSSFRILRSVKNRFGSTNEMGIFDMTKDGLVEVDNPSEIFLSVNGEARKCGSCVFPAILGSRPFLIEVQALTSKSFYPTPTRRVTGADFNRVQQIAAILEKRVGLYLSSQDIFINVVGGVNLDEPACDLAIAIAMASSFKEIPISNDSVFCGEIGLDGEIRAVKQINQRLQEAQKLGFKNAFVPLRNKREVDNNTYTLEIVYLKSLKEAIDKLR